MDTGAAAGAVCVVSKSLRLSDPGGRLALGTHIKTVGRGSWLSRGHRHLLLDHYGLFGNKGLASHWAGPSGSGAPLWW